MTGSNPPSPQKPIIVQYDNSLNILHANTEALEFTGNIGREVRNLSCPEFWGHPPDKRCQTCPLYIFHKNNDFSTSLIQLHGSDNWWKFAISELYDHSGTRTGFLAVYTQVNDNESPRKPLDQLLENQFVLHPVPQIIVDFHSGFTVMANAAFQELSGINSEDIYRFSIYNAESLKTIFSDQIINEIRESGHTDGHLVKLDEQNLPKIYSLSGERINIQDMSLISFRLEDVTENESLKSLISRLNNRFLSAFENAKTNVWEYDIQNNRFFVLDYYQQSGNPLYELDTTSSEQFLDNDVDLEVFPEDFSAIYQAVILLKEKNTQIDTTYHFTNPLNQQEEIHQIQGHITEWNTDRSPLTAQGTITNISELYFLEEERSRASVLYDHLFQQSPVMIMRIRHEDGSILDANKATLKFCGKNLEEILGKHPAEIGIWPESRQSWKNFFSIFDRDLVLKDIQVPLLDKDGMLHQVLLSVSYGVWNDIPSALAIGLDMTDAYQLQQQLLTTQQQMQNALEAINEGYFDLNLLDNDVFANDNCLKLLGYEPGEISFSFSNWVSTVFKKDRRKVVESFRQMIGGQITQDSFRLRMLKKDGTLIWILHQHKVAEFDHQNKPIRIVGTITDLTEQIKIEQELEYQKDTLEATFTAIDEGIWEYDRRNRTITLNTRCKELVNFLDIPNLTPTKFRSMIPQIIHPDDMDLVRSTFRSMLDGKEETIQVEGRLSGDGQSWRWFNMRGGIIERNQTGTPTRLVGAIADITERKELEWMMRLAMAGIEQTSMMAFLIRPDGSFHYVNQQSSTQLGYSLDEMYALNAHEIDPTFHPNDESIKIEFEESPDSGLQVPLTDLEITLYRKDGTHFPARISRRIVRYHDAYYFWVFAIDISDIKSMEQSLRDERASLAQRVKERTQELAAVNEYLDFILQVIPIPIYIKNENLEYVDINEAFMDYFNVTRDELIGKTVYAYSSEERASIVWKDDMNILHTNNKITTQESMRNGENELREVIVMRQGFENPRTGEYGIIGAFIDIHERLQLQKELETANQDLQHAMQVKDEFLANMSHELRTPLTSIIGYSELLLAGMGGKLHSNQDKYINHIQFAGQHLLSLINDILDYSKFNAEVSQLNLETVRVRSICIAALSIMEPRAFKKDIQMEFEFDDTINELYCDQQRLRQILINLLNNAIKFSDNYGTIGLRVKQLIGPTPIVEFQVWDNGIGIDPDDQSRIFEPFIQVASDLKRNYEGSGIGLALVKKFVELHDGTIWVESEVNRGSIFYIQIPIKEEPQSPAVISSD